MIYQAEKKIKADEALLRSDMNVQVCDATDDESSTTAKFPIKTST